MEYFSSNKAIILKNKTCPYCGIELNEENSTKEHVIGRKFVPKGSLENSWNLILKACSKCNNHKSDLEDDISAITQIEAASLEKLEGRKQEIRKKAENSYSRRTKKSVLKSIENFTIPFSLGEGINATLSIIANRQIDDDRAKELSIMYLRAFFYLLTYQEDECIGHFWPGAYIYLKKSDRSNWGNAINKQFLAIIEKWELRFNGIAADYNFKCNIRKNIDLECWSWALEWNQNTRIIGFLGNEKSIRELILKFKPEEYGIITNSNNETIKIIKDTPLLDQDDAMFIGNEDT